ncbi:transposase [Elioraea sp.]|uniref:transposase n=1 Tax=Elioraea sp. TaxID=2185103 RepID=UPI00307F8DB3
MLVLQALHGLSLAQTEYLVADRPSWMRSCRLALGDAVPDANTPQDFHEALIVAGTLDALFARLDRAISEAGYLPMAGQIGATPRSERRGDPGGATLVAAPRQRHTEAEKVRIKAGKRPRRSGPTKPTGRPPPRHQVRANAAKSAVRAHVEHPFAHRKG